MEIKTRQVDDKPLTIIIEYPILDTKTKRLIKKIEALDFVVSGNSKGKVFQVPISDIYYMEAVERKTFLYTKAEVYMTDTKLYEFEEMFRETGIIILVVFSFSLLLVGMKPEILLVFEIFILSFFVTVIQYCLKQVICTYFFVNIMIEYVSVSVFVFLYGYFVEWFFRSNWWMAFVYVAIVYIPAYFLDMAVVKRDINYINAQLERRRKSNEGI